MTLQHESTVVTRSMTLELFETLVEHLPDAVIFADSERRIEFVNEGFVDLFGYEPGEVIGDDTSGLYADPMDFHEQGERRFNPQASPLPGAYIVEYRRKNGEVFLGETRGMPVRNDEGATLGYMGIVRDVTRIVNNAGELQEVRRELAERLKRSQMLFDLSTREYGSVDDLLEFALSKGCELMGEETAIFSQISGQKYVVGAYVSDTGESVEPGTTFDLGKTYCAITLEQGGVFATHHMGESEYAGHPCYENFTLESYIGAAVEIGGEMIGTLNFTSRMPRDHAHTKADKEFVAMLANWLGVFVDRARARRRLAKHNQDINAVLELQEVMQKTGLTTSESVRAFVEFVWDIVGLRGLAVAVFDADCLAVADARGSLAPLTGKELPEHLVPEVAEQSSQPSLRRWQTSRRAAQDAGVTFCANLSYSGDTFGALLAEVDDEDSFDQGDRPVIELSTGLLAARLSVVQQYERAQREATTDALTGLSNRRDSIRRIESARDDATGGAIEVAILDADNFKNVNDTWGHLAGDEVLKVLADILEAHLPDAVVTGRLGGEEFIVASRMTGRARLARDLRDVLEAFREHEFEASESTFSVTFSAGVAILDESEDIYAAVERADVGLYDAKRNGRARVVQYSPELDV